LLGIEGLNVFEFAHALVLVADAKAGRDIIPPFAQQPFFPLGLF